MKEYWIPMPSNWWQYIEYDDGGYEWRLKVHALRAVKEAGGILFCGPYISNTSASVHFPDDETAIAFRLTLP